MSEKPEVSIIIPVFNKWQLTLDCLVSLKEHTPGTSYEVIVVDNASKDATITQLEPLGKALFGKRFTAIRNPENRNYGPACNQGVRAAAAPLIFFLNNDTLMTKDWLPPLLAALRDDPDLGAVGPLLLYMNDTIQHIGVTFFISSVWHLYQNYPRDHAIVKRKRDLQAITAAAMLIPKDLFWECGGFYEEYKNGFEDVELCLQIGLRGRKMRCITESVIYHLESQTPGRNANERGNSKLLTERCMHLIRYDAHIHAVRDKFKPLIDDRLSLAFCLNDKDNATLTKEARSKPFRWLHDTLAAHPGWLQGMEMLQEMSMSCGDYQTALMYADMKANLYATYADYEAILRLAILSRHEEMIYYTRKGMEHFRANFKGNPCRVENTLRNRLRRALEVDDKLLIHMLEEKIADVRLKTFPAPPNPRYPDY